MVLLDMHKKSLILLTSLVLSSLACSFPQTRSARLPAEASPELNKESIPDDEAQSIEAIATGAAAGLNSTFKPDTVATRDAHAAHQGCVKARFKVNEGLSDELKQGIFADDASGKPRQYKAWVRYSSGSGKPQPDFIPDGRGMAIKVIGVDGPRAALEKVFEKRTQDFLMINFPQFFVKNAKDYVDFNRDRAAFIASHPDAAQIIGAMGRQFVTSPLETQFFSMTPISLGARAIKYSARPCEAAQSMKIGDLDLVPLVTTLMSIKGPADFPNHLGELAPYASYLKTGMTTQLAEKDYCFDFMVQFQDDAEKSPVEDPTVRWNGEFHPVAKVFIPKQSFAGNDEFCQNLSMTPWHALEAHRPLGGIQRVRRKVYGVISELRHQHNKAALQEPTGDEQF